MQVIGPAHVVIKIKRKSSPPREIKTVCVIGGGLAGCEAAWQLARAGVPVRLYEMRKGGVKTPAHAGDGLAELVCSNSFRSDDALSNAVGLLHAELRACGSLVMRAADACKVPAGGALAVDRVAFSREVEHAVASCPLITLVPEAIEDLSVFGDHPVIVATGPLTSPALTEQIIELTGREQLAFFDAIAPIVMHDSIDFNVAWKQSRYDKGEGEDYINLPMNEQQYFKFVELLLAAETHAFKDWEKNTPYFNGCLPIEVMAERGPQTLRFGPMKPVGLRNPHRLDQPYAVVQLRQDNRSGTLFNMVGFQTKMNYRDQKEVFRTIPGLERAEFARLGGIHRNTFINSPSLLDDHLRLRSHPHIRFAGQITGVEGYVESAACGFAAGVSLAAELKQAPVALPGKETAIGALAAHITGQAYAETFQPMNINYGLLAPLEENDETDKIARRAAFHRRAMSHIRFWNAQLRSILFNEPGEADHMEVKLNATG